MNKIFLIFLTLFFLSSNALAEAVPDILFQKLNAVAPGYDKDSVKLTPLTGIYEFIAQGKVFYISEDGHYVINGNIIDIDKKQNLTELTHRKVIKKVMDSYDMNKSITFSPDGKTLHTISVFTDVDCPYCTMLHKEVPKLNKAGVEVRYLMYPRAGPGSSTFIKSVSAWCNDDQKKAIGIAKAGGVVVAMNCDNPVKEQFELGLSIGVTGTPTLILENGQLLPGFLPADKLLDVLKEKG